MDIKKILFRTTTIDVEKALPDAVIFCGKDGKIQWVNDKAADVLETSKMHLLTSNINDFIENGLNIIINSIYTDKQLIVKMKSKEIYFDMTAKEIEDGYVIDLRDTLPENKPNLYNTDDYSPSNKDKNTLLVKISNDIKSPLQSIIGFAQAMTDGLGGNMSEQQEKYIRIIRKNSADLMYLLSKLVELSETELVINKPEIKTFDIVSLINNLIKYNEQLTKEKDLNWSLEVADDVKRTVASDEKIVKAIVQDILEVITRAVDIGEIAITVSVPEAEIVEAKSLATGNYLMISIKSSSLLLSENDLDFMFDPYKIIDTTNRKNLLRAVTLACVKNLIQLLGGVVWIESKILKNTSFNIIIPQN